MKPYEKYKESGVEWVGKIPKNWQFVKLKQLVSCNDETLTIRDNDNFFINYIEIGDVNLEKGVANYSNVHIQEAPSRARRIVKANDIIISTVRTYLKAIAKVPEEYNDFIASTGFAILRAKAIDYNFLNFVVQNEDFINEVISLSVGASYPAISSNNLINIKVALPTLEEQTAIANYLDHQTAIIDELIEKKTKQIVLLKEKRQAIINETVTKGLDPTAKMKDSGVEWLGEIPESWEVKKLKFVYNIKKQIAGELGYNVLSVTQKGIKIRDLDNLKGQLSMDYSKYQLVEKGDFIMNHMDLLTGFIDISNWDGVTSPDYRVFHSIDKNCIDEYYLFIFQFCYYNKIFFGLGQGVSQLGRWRMPAESFNNFIVPYPSREEQQQIVDFLIRYTKATDETIDKQLLAIGKLKEYRQSLISEVVTGKIDVRTWQQ